MTALRHCGRTHVITVALTARRRLQRCCAPVWTLTMTEVNQPSFVKSTWPTIPCHAAAKRQTKSRIVLLARRLLLSGHGFSAETGGYIANRQGEEKTTEVYVCFVAVYRGRILMSESSCHDSLYRLGSELKISTNGQLIIQLMRRSINHQANNFIGH